MSDDRRTEDIERTAREAAAELRAGELCNAGRVTLQLGAETVILVRALVDLKDHRRADMTEPVVSLPALVEELVHEALAARLQREAAALTMPSLLASELERAVQQERPGPSEPPPWKREPDTQQRAELICDLASALKSLRDGQLTTRTIADADLALQLFEEGDAGHEARETMQIALVGRPTA